MKQNTRRVGRLVAGAVVCALALSACGSDTDESADQTSASRMVEHARGTTEVPGDPQRVVVLEPVQLDTSIALGVVPVGAAVLSESTGVPAYLGDKASTVELAGTVAEPNLEKIAALDPDLIIGTQTRHGEMYEQFAAIAPTVFMASQSDPWQDNVRFVADALGRSDDAQALLDNYTDRCDEVSTEHSTEGKTAQLIRPRDEQLTLYGPVSFAGSALECAGFTIPPRDWENSISVDVSYEHATEARADIVLVTSGTPDDPTSVPPVVTDRELFPNMHVVDMSYWITGVGPLGGLTVLDDLDELLTESADAN
ncbi:iron complex transport system substrate-binding protein [Rhodococcus sp. SMB37]|uniref:ABC transporter substrate-binding protein n=1 Tax=Rhodococcus sp. SMB37 TaxID=2512213 RepID=UPI0010504C79|nr:iron-siderophore ABC transporter substrate-binding protein [Rhodococcus sp. SMB37]TCN48175.1 iron complex transport system substrate-binding protein [Rhodococcus sp. SMB37]